MAPDPDPDPNPDPDPGFYLNLRNFLNKTEFSNFVLFFFADF